MRALSLEKLAEMLRDFGLTSNQAKVYLAAVQLGVAQVNQISQASKVRREDTYRTLQTLEKMGLIEKISSTPIRIRAVPVEDALSILIKQWKDVVDNKERELTIRKDEFLKSFKGYKKPTLSEEENHFALLTEKNAVINKMKAMIKGAEKEIDLITSKDELLKFLPESFTEPLLEAIGKKQVKTRIILEVPPHETSLPKNTENYLSSKASIDLKYTCEPLSHYFVVDYAQVLMATSPQLSVGKLPYLWTDTTSFARLLQKHFEDSWHTCATSQINQTDV